MSNRNLKAALHNLGCKVNAYETEAMSQLLEEAGYAIVPFEEKADVYIINTCSVTNIADRKSRQMLHRAKKKNPNALVVAAGCYVQTHTEQATADAAVDLIIGNNEKATLVSRIEEMLAARTDLSPKGEILDINRTKVSYEEMFITKTDEHTRAFIKVQDGCNQFCTYCIIPFARGRARSRSAESVLKEVSTLAEAGYQEFVITGIHLSSYGLQQEYNLVYKQPVVQEALLELISAVAEIEGVKRIRLGSLEPQVITEDFTAQLAQIEKICPQFHLSLQSGCDATLQRMNRHYSCDEYLTACDILRKYFNNPAITTDVIVGFPGESEEEFDQTKAFLNKVGFAKMHIFPYSKREGTRAAAMADQVPEPVKKARSEELLALDKELEQSFRASYIGREVEVLVENDNAGYTREYLRVQLQSPENLENKIIKMRFYE